MSDKLQYAYATADSNDLCLLLTGSILLLAMMVLLGCFVSLIVVACWVASVCDRPTAALVCVHES